MKFNTLALLSLRFGKNEIRAKTVELNGLMCSWQIFKRSYTSRYNCHIFIKLEVATHAGAIFERQYFCNVKKMAVY